LLPGTRGASVPAVSPGWYDGGERFEIEFSDGLESLGGGAVAKAIGKCFEPGGIVGLQGEEFVDGVMPALRAGTAVGGTAIADGGLFLPGLAAGTVSGLALGVGESVVALWLAAAWHGVFSVT
jgi:hypothetical protein